MKFRYQDSSETNKKRIKNKYFDTYILKEGMLFIYDISQFCIQILLAYICFATEYID
jgi:hypothetical protein